MGGGCRSRGLEGLREIGSLVVFVLVVVFFLWIGNCCGEGVWEMDIWHYGGRRDIVGRGTYVMAARFGVGAVVFGHIFHGVCWSDYLCGTFLSCR